ncbi:hypothetical protein [Pantoea eucrina]|uniref:hypothetical protein n=1 Tax=Pantoea eucrina TaxID=472693 RepID=UPI00080F3A95|nr:hypothetical protein [Pantoea eucrina]
MKKEFEEKLTEILIGEAVTDLLDANAAISWTALLDRLRVGLDKETDEDRIRAALRAIDEVRREMQVRASEKAIITESDRRPARDKMH